MTICRAIAVYEVVNSARDIDRLVRDGVMPTYFARELAEALAKLAEAGG